MTPRLYLWLAGIVGALTAAEFALARAQDTAATWSQATQISIPSDKGALRVQKQSTVVSGQPVDLVYSAADDAAWIGPSAGCYYSSDGVIWSCMALRQRVILRHSTGSVMPDQLGAFADAWTASPTNQDWNTARVAGTVAFDFVAIFGRGAVQPYGRAELAGYQPRLGNARIGAGQRRLRICCRQQA